MNRTFKFRVWLSEENRFLETKDGLFFKYPHNEMGEYIGDFIRDPYFVQQFTGIKDKNGREIYEGDILQRPESFLPNYFEVYWNEAAAKFGTKVHMRHNKMLAVYPVVTGDFDKCEIVGNIFENSDLIKK